MRIHLYSVQRERDERVSEYDYNLYAVLSPRLFPPKRIQVYAPGSSPPR